MHLPLLRQFKRLLPFLALGAGTMLLILGLSLNASTAQLLPVGQDPPAFGTSLEPPKSPNAGGLGSIRFPQHWMLGGSNDLNAANFELRADNSLEKGSRGDLIAQTSQPISPTLNLVQQGKAAYQNGQLKQAVTVWKQAADAFAGQDDRLHEAMTLSYLAQAYQQLGEWDKANTAIAQSLQLLKQANQGAGDRLRILAEAQTIQGSLQLDQGQPSEAYASWQQAVNAFQQAGNQAGVIRSQLNQSQALIELGLYKRANKLLASLYEKLPSEESLQLGILLNYGETLRLIGQLQRSELAQPPIPASVVLLEQGLKLAQKLKSPVDITKAQISLGNTYRAIYQQQNRLQANPCPDPKVLAYRQKALQSYQAAIEGTTAPTSKIQALLNQQSLLLAPQGDTDTISTEQANHAEKVAAIATQIQAQLDRLPLNRPALYARIQLAYNLLKLDQTPSRLKDVEPQGSEASNQAIQLLKAAAKDAETLGDQSAQSYALGYLGQAYAQQQQGNEALESTTQALTLKALNIAKTINAPEIAYRWFWQLGRIDRAKNPERAIREYRAAYTTLKDFRSNLPAENPDLQFSFQAQPVEPAYREFVDLLLQAQGDGTKQLQERAQGEGTHLEEARNVMRDIQVTALQNFLQKPCEEADLKLLDKIVDTSNAAATLFPIILPDRIEVIARLPNQPLFHYRTVIPDTVVKQAINQFQLDLQESYTFDAVKAEGKQLYQWLIQPIRDQLNPAQIKTIVFVLDGPLRNIPMAALYDGEHYLIESYAVSVSLGLDLSSPQPLHNEHLNVLAASLANPPEQTDEKVKLAKLTYVNAELDAIQKTVGGTTTMRDEKFTLNAFNNRLSNAPFEIVHLATHGQFSSNPDETFVLTMPTRLPNGKRFDGKVRLKDFDALFRTRVLNRADAIQLLILSACETASGDTRATLGIAGAAVNAGARSAIASLWSLDDQSSQVFMETFYQAITQPKVSRAEALQKAQLALLQQEAYAHPRYWAPFLLVGNWL
ncbi:MAG: CHAT domain-containing protein [Leptolyngbya sp. BL-A-14]